jgi:hypothetical protein
VKSDVGFASIEDVSALLGVNLLIGARARLSSKNLPCPMTKKSPHAKLSICKNDASLSSVKAT